MAPERKIPVDRSETHVVNDEFKSMREHFQAEMKRMEEEMAQLRTQLQERSDTSPNQAFKSSASIRMHATEESSSSSQKSSSTTDNRGHHWTDDLSSPLIQNGDDGKSLKLRFDVRDYEPSEILVKTVDNKLKVSAKHEEKTPNKTVFREYNREFLLPTGTNIELIKSSLSRDGVLTVEAPLPTIESYRERNIPIAKC